ncbi:hypothetical protein D6D01_07625 [Aureobasidium pullulans]|uniref:Uncharacterized protein n=1 Tax=Aureobasidium pullulans TaxID=5580 RepID=A0A4S9KMN2_AURPU|nr:hypothetical protein D6D01_07625 [Aureobasidium pullulans]
MPHLTSEPSKANPWESVRYVLYVFWLIQFWICGCLAVAGVAGLFETPFDYNNVLCLVGVIVVDYVYVSQMHLYAMGKLEPAHAVKMQSVQCLTIVLLLVKLSYMMANQFMGAIAFLYSLPFAATFLLQWLVTVGVLKSSRRQQLHPVQLDDLSDKI